MSDLKEIILTKEKGFVLKDTDEPVEILGGVTTGRVTKNKPEEIVSGLIDTIERVYAEHVPEGTNGYIIHGKMQVGDVPHTIPLEAREFMTHFSAVKYRKK